MTIAALERSFIGALGLRREEMINTCVGDLITRLNYKQLENERQQRDAWERMRLQTAYMLNFFSKKNNRIKDLQKFMPLPWDEVSTVDITELTEEQKRDSIQRLLKTMNDA